MSQLDASVCCPFSTVVSAAILCPLAQPNQAIGLESQIGSWLAISSQPLLLCSFTSRRSSHHRHETYQAKPATHTLARDNCAEKP
jgi:hypothetical protein